MTGEGDSLPHECALRGHYSGRQGPELLLQRGCLPGCTVDVPDSPRLPFRPAESYLLALIGYVAVNPVRAAMVKRPEEYRWSSYRATAGYEAAPPPWLTTDWALGPFGQDLATQQSGYRQFVDEGAGISGPPSRMRSVSSSSAPLPGSPLMLPEGIVSLRGNSLILRGPLLSFGEPVLSSGKHR